MLENSELRQWIEAQPVESIRVATMRPYPGPRDADFTASELTIVTSRYEIAATAVARDDGSHVSVDLPANVNRILVFPRHPGTIPPAAALAADPETYVLGEDMWVGPLLLPSGRIVIGDELLNERTFHLRVAPGDYDVIATVAKPRGDGRERVALATVVLSRAPTARWQREGGVRVGVGSVIVNSPEGVAVLQRVVEDRPSFWPTVRDGIDVSLVAHDLLGANFALGNNQNLVEFGSAPGGPYPILVGYDAAGRPTRIVVDFRLLPIRWRR